MQKVASVGAGLSGLSLAYYLKKEHLGLDITIFESARIGGQIHTETVEDCLVDSGPETYLARTPILHALAEELGIADDLIFADQSAKKRFIVKDGRLVKLPGSALSFLFNSSKQIKHSLYIIYIRENYVI